MGLILPRTKIDLDGKNIIFLAGPIAGTSGWHDEAIAYIGRRAPDLYIACPNERVQEATFAMKGEEGFERNLGWEKHHYKYALKKGCMMFWLPTQSRVIKSDKRFARDTQKELGFVLGKLDDNLDPRFILGGSEKHDGYDVTIRDFREYIPETPYYLNLEDTCDAAIRVATR